MAMTKVFSPSGWDFDAPIASLVKIASSGKLGHNDRLAFIKRAGACGTSLFEKEVAHLKFAKDSIPIHLIALGASEAYGPNRNGDAFSEATLKAAHDTFVKHAYWFRNHKNKPHEGHPKFGLVKASFYNDQMRRVELLCELPTTKEAAERMGVCLADKELEKLANDDDIAVSMACRVPYDVCFKAKTVIETLNGPIYIKDVKIGDVVKTHTGAWQKVSKVMRRPYAGTVVHLEVLGLLDVLTCTASHPFLALPANELTGCRGTVNGKSRRHTVRNGETCVTCDTAVIPELVWTNATDLKIGDFVVYPVKRPGNENVPAHRAYLAGLYVGDGSLIRQGRGRKKQGKKRTQGFSVTLDKAHPSIVSRVKQYAEMLHGRTQPAYESGNNKNSFQLPIYSREYGFWLFKTFGKGSRAKKIKEEIFDWDAESRMQFLAGLIDSDGSVDRGLRFGSGRFTTTNRGLAESVQRLCWGLGIHAGIHSQRVQCGYSSLSPVTCFTVTIPRSGVVKIGDRSCKCADITPPDRNHSRAIFLGDYVYLPVTRVVQEYDELDVYNLHVPGDESYVVGVAVHNCSGCHNKARTREEYCKEANCKHGGCANNLTKLVKIAGDAHILHVDNPNPCFFDISNVFRPADRIAYAGKADWVKAASDGFFGISGVKTAEDIGVTAPLSVVLAQDYLLPGQYSNYLQEQVKLAYALAALDQQPEKWANDFVYRAFTPDVQPELNLEALELTSPKLEKVAAGLGALADQKILLSLRDFGRMTKRASLVADAGNCLKGVYYRMIEDGSLEHRLKENRYAPIEKLASFAQRQAVSKIVSTYSLEKTAVETRCQQSVMRGYPAPVSKTTFWIEKKAHDSPLAEGLARDYAIYKIASLRRISQFDSEFLLTARLSACQNQVH